MHNSKNLKRLAGISAVMACLIANPSNAKDLRAAVGVPEGHAVEDAWVNFAKGMGEIGYPTKVFFSGSLLSLQESPAGVRDGLADIGFLVMPYSPTEFSEAIVPQQLAMLATSGEQVQNPAAAMAGAQIEYTLLNCPDCLAQMKAQNQVFTAASSTGAYILGCKEPVLSLADLKGKNIRSGSATHTRWAEFVGANPVQLPGGEMYDALSKGVVDCVALSIGDYLGWKLNEIGKELTVNVPGSVFVSIAFANFNRDVWQAMSGDEREKALRLAARATAESTLGYVGLDVEASDLFGKKESGMTIHDADADVVSKTEEFIEADLKAVEVELTTNYNIQNASEKIAMVTDLVTKWKALTKDIDHTGVDALEQVYWDEVYSKIDPTTYGMD